MRATPLGVDQGCIAGALCPSVVVRHDLHERSVCTMIRQSFPLLVHPTEASVSRRAIVQRLGRAGFVAAGVAIVPHLVRAQDATPTADLQANKALARRFHDEIFEQGHVEVADDILTADFVWHSPPQTVYLVGPEAIKQQATELRSFIPDLVLTDDDEIAEGDRVVIRWTLTGTAQGESGPVPVIYTGIDIFRITDGRLAELWQNTDDLGLEEQLSAGTALGTPAAGTPTS
jgi:predicted SnoaL-like aldol condensation-catalyzing enzyme